MNWQGRFWKYIWFHYGFSSTPGHRAQLQHLSTVTADSDRFPLGGPFPTTGGEAFQHSPETRLISLQPSTSRSMVSRTSRYPQLLKPTAGGWESTFPPPSPSQKKTNKHGDVYPGSLWWFNTNFLCFFLLNRNQWTCLIQDLDWTTNCLEGKCKVSSLDPLLVDEAQDLYTVDPTSTRQSAIIISTFGGVMWIGGNLCSAGTPAWFFRGTLLNYTLNLKWGLYALVPSRMKKVDMKIWSSRLC